MPFKVGQNLFLEVFISWMKFSTRVKLITKLLCEKDMVIQNMTKTLTMREWRESWLGCPLETQKYTEALKKYNHGFYNKKNMLAFICLCLWGSVVKEETLTHSHQMKFCLLFLWGHSLKISTGILKTLPTQFMISVLGNIWFCLTTVMEYLQWKTPSLKK